MPVSYLLHAAGVLVTAAVCVWPAVQAMEPGMAGDAGAPGLLHAHHHVAAPEFIRSVAEYTVPDVTLVRADGNQVRLMDEIGDQRAVVLSFIYTSCTTVCPVTSATLSELQDALGTARDRVHLVSISIDPEFDTPARLRAYAARYDAGPAWQHYTGTLAASVAAQQAFAVYHGDKMSHTPVTLIRIAPGTRWIRMDGFASAHQIVEELQCVVDLR